MTALVCPSCAIGRLTVGVQVSAALTDGELDTDWPTTDDFVSAWCSNPDCVDALAQEPGDGRLRRAHVERDGEPVDEPELEERWISAVEVALTPL